MEEKQALQNAENALRDFIAKTLEEKFGAEWPDKCGLPMPRIEKWREKLEVESKKQKHSSCDPRLIYYSDFYDLGSLINKNWPVFNLALGDKKEIEVFLGLLENFRNANAHGRELLTYQKHLAIGISGEIRNRITKFRSLQDTGESYFPRLDSIHDNYGNSWKSGDVMNIRTRMILREGDILEFVVAATDPKDEEIEYSMSAPHDWQNSNHFEVLLNTEHIGDERLVPIYIRSKRPYHAKQGYDDAVIFTYNVLPRAQPQLLEEQTAPSQKIVDLGDKGGTIDTPVHAKGIFTRLKSFIK